MVCRVKVVAATSCAVGDRQWDCTFPAAKCLIHKAPKIFLGSTPRKKPARRIILLCARSYPCVSYKSAHLRRCVAGACVFRGPASRHFLATRLSRNITLNIPLVSAAMDTVTESRLAIAMAQEGGIGIIHKNLSADAQAREVARVKRHEFGIVIDPVTVTPLMKVRDAIALQRQHGISGLPVVEGGKLVGIVTNRDLRFEETSTSRCATS